MLGKICCLIANKEIVNSVGEYQVANQCQSSLSWVFSWTVQNNLAPVLTYQTVNSTFWIPPPSKLYIWFILVVFIPNNIPKNKSYSHIGGDTVNYEWLAVTIMSRTLSYVWCVFVQFIFPYCETVITRLTITQIQHTASLILAHTFNFWYEMWGKICAWQSYDPCSYWACPVYWPGLVGELG